jgi:two-component system, chemotaxis family, response regulator Rcp1
MGWSEMEGSAPVGRGGPGMVTMDTFELGRPAVVLLVEDNPADVELTRAALDDEGVHVQLMVAGDGAETLDFLARRGAFEGAPRPSLILLDLNLPGMSGRELFAEIRADEALADIPIAVFTTSGSERDILWSEDVEATAYVRKPLDFDQLMRVVDACPSLRWSLVDIS